MWFLLQWNITKQAYETFKIKQTQRQTLGENVLKTIYKKPPRNSKLLKNENWNLYQKIWTWKIWRPRAIEKPYWKRKEMYSFCQTCKLYVKSSNEKHQSSLGRMKEPNRIPNTKKKKLLPKLYMLLNLKTEKKSFIQIVHLHYDKK